MIGLAGQSAASGQPMLLERETQLTSLRRLLAAARRQRGRLVLLAGEAGIGKTTLAEAFCAQAAPSARVFWGSCEPVIPARPFAPIAQIARSAGGQLRVAIETANPDAIFSGFMALLRVTRARPTIVVLDDVPWADEATLELLRLATRQLADVPALLLATYRDHRRLASTGLARHSLLPSYSAMRRPMSTP